MTSSSARPPWFRDRAALLTQVGKEASGALRRPRTPGAAVYVSTNKRRHICDTASAKSKISFLHVEDWHGVCRRLHVCSYTRHMAVQMVLTVTLGK